MIMAAGAAPSITDWISAISTLVIGVATGVFAYYQWKKSGFGPRVIVDLESTGERAIVRIENEGRGAGAVTAVEVIRSGQDPAVLPSTIQAQTSSTTLPQTILQPGAMMIVVRKAAPRPGESAPANGRWEFPAGAHVLISMSGRELKLPLRKNANAFLDTTMTQLPEAK